ncbi:MAG: hypothetical protein WCC10_17370 [Tumebacillaceae bacterium]
MKPPEREKQRISLRVSITFLLIVLAIIAGFLYSAERGQPMEQPKATLPAPPTFTNAEEEHLYRFLALHMTDPYGGTYTNLQPSAADEVQGNTATGHAVLSESVGLLMEYAVLSNNLALFDLQTHLLQQRFIQKDFIRWVVPSQGTAPAPNVNAALDDLRIIGALLSGANTFHQPHAHQLALQLAQSLRAHNEKQGYLLDYASADRTTLAPSVQVRYLDLATLAKLQQLDPAYIPIYQHGANLYRQALQPSGLYATAYLPDKQAFQQENNRTAVTPNMSEQLVAALHAQAADLPTDGMRNLLKRTLTSRGRLFATVTYEGSPATTVESPAVYALAARFLQRAGEDDFAKRCLSRLRDFQVPPPHQYQGGFVDLKSLTAFSFDQLQALLALREADPADPADR